MRKVKRPAKHSLITASLLAALYSPLSAASTEPASLALPHADPNENLLIKSLEDIQAQRLDGALQTLESLVQENPTFKLAQLIYGDMLLARAGPISDIGGGLIGSSNDTLAGLRNEAQARWQHHTTHPAASKLPSYVLQLNNDIEHVVVVDLKKPRLYLYSNTNGQIDLVSDYYVSIGKNGAVKHKEGDKRTPTGVYFITEFKGPNSLPDFYGSGAFPIDYPNTWDKRQGKTGYGIWLHGTPLETFSRRPRASDGCVTLSNSDLEAIMPLLKPGITPVIIAKEIDWVEGTKLAGTQQQFSDLLEQWRNDWQSRESERYLSHYSRNFKSSSMDYRRWSRHKNKVNQSKTFIEVGLKNVNIFAYPGNQSMRVVTFEQEYNSNNYSNASTKQQYWQLEEDGVWRIIYEGPA